MGIMSIREAYGRALAAYGAENPEVVVLDADTSSSTLSHFFAEAFPDRFFNVGIAEPCLVDVAVGLALGGKIPFANAFAALISLRAAEQVRTSVCYGRTNVKLAAGYAGLSDFKDGPTHNAIMDLAVMRAMPEMTVIVPADAVETSKWVKVVAEYDGPVYLRLSRAAAQSIHDEGLRVEIGKGLTLRPGTDVCLIATGSMVGRTMEAAEGLAREGIEARVLEIHTLKPLDRDLVIQAAEETGALVTAEEHSVIGGLAGAVSEALTEAFPAPLERVGLRDTFGRTGLDAEALMDFYGLGVEDIIKAGKRVLERKTTRNVDRVRPA
ncbi:MAG TPA: transketolase C-terminal domain-containing protein [Anaerolineales bacterium]|nr:transketolase C-terminal domain-containing protein [Anaerolineales bacterium]